MPKKEEGIQNMQIVKWTTLNVSSQLCLLEKILKNNDFSPCREHSY